MLCGLPGGKEQKHCNNDMLTCSSSELNQHMHIFLPNNLVSMVDSNVSDFDSYYLHIHVNTYEMGVMIIEIIGFNMFCDLCESTYLRKYTCQ